MWSKSVIYHHLSLHNHNTPLPCRYFGCVSYENIFVNDTNVLSKLERLYNQYYKGLFSFLEMYVKAYAYVDVFHGIYSNLNLISPNLTYPFKQYNSRIKRTHGVHNYKFCPKITNNS